MRGFGTRSPRLLQAHDVGAEASFGALAEQVRGSRDFSRRGGRRSSKPPVNALGYLRVMFAVDDLDETLARLRRHGAQLVDEVVQYQDVYRLCYVRGPEGILIGLAEQIG